MCRPPLLLLRTQFSTVGAIMEAQEVCREQPGFTRWLREQSQRNDRIGDLARDLRVDADWPTKSQKFDTFWAHLQAQHADDSALESFVYAWLEFLDAGWDYDAKFRIAIPDDVRWTVWERDDFSCRHCGARRHLSIDHIVAVVKGGTNELDNLQTLCRSCNSKKGSR